MLFYPETCLEFSSNSALDTLDATANLEDKKQREVLGSQHDEMITAFFQNVNSHRSCFEVDFMPRL